MRWYLLDVRGATKYLHLLCWITVRHTEYISTPRKVERIFRVRHKQKTGGVTFQKNNFVCFGQTQQFLFKITVNILQFWILNPDKLIHIIQQVYSATYLQQFIHTISELPAAFLVFFFLRKWTHNREFNAKIHFSFSHKYLFRFVENSRKFRLNCCHVSHLLSPFCLSTGTPFLSLICSHVCHSNHVAFLPLNCCHLHITTLLSRFCHSFVSRFCHFSVTFLAFVCWHVSVTQ
jgi:hypothetical protein